MHHDSGSVPESPQGISPPLLGSKLPELPVRSVGNAEANLRTIALEKPTVIAFYRGGW